MCRDIHSVRGGPAAAGDSYVHIVHTIVCLLGVTWTLDDGVEVRTRRNALVLDAAARGSRLAKVGMEPS